jgi:hypothetical protein
MRVQLTGYSRQSYVLFGLVYEVLDKRPGQYGGIQYKIMSSGDIPIWIHLDGDSHSAPAKWEEVKD